MLIDGSALGWRAVFLVNLPVVALTIPAALVWLPESRGGSDLRLDVGGAVLWRRRCRRWSFRIIEGRELGWPLWSFVMLAAAPALAPRVLALRASPGGAGGNPLVHPDAFRSPACCGGSRRR